MLLEDLFLKTMRDPDFQQAAARAVYVVTPMDSVDTKMRIMEYDTDVYPILLKAGLVTQRKK